MTLPGCGSGTGAEQCVLAVTACLSLFVTSRRAAGSYFLLTVWPWPALQLQLCIPEPKASAKASLQTFSVQMKADADYATGQAWVLF